jgi:mannose-1-phosphate guanylyltransferase/mannose-6-phosphate isomerase
LVVHPIILCGGPGARLWPVSTPERPKPFIALLGERSLFQATAQRVSRISGAGRPLVVTGVAHIEEGRRQLAAIGVEANFLIEPCGRDSGPALIAATLWVARDDPEAAVLVVAADHHIPDADAFAASVAAASAAAADGAIVTFGARPTFAATVYGYIRAGEPLPGAGAARRVDAFVEKPDAAKAAGLLRAGALWNSGNFLFRADVMLTETAAHAPEMLASVRQAVADGVHSGDAFELGPAFAQAPRVSIDVAVMEKTDRAAVLPIDHDWSDVGSWPAIWALSPHDLAGNSVEGAAVAGESEDCLVRAGPGMEVIALGLKSVAVIAEDGKVLVSDMARSADLKAALQDLRNTARGAPVAKAGEVAGRLSRWLRQSALPLWWSFGADHVGGGFHEALERDLTPAGATRRTRVQARQIQVYAAAGLAGWPGPWRDAVDHGLADLFDHRQRADGLFHGLTDTRGSPLDGAGPLYDQAFVLLALATAARAWPERADDLRARGLALGAAVRQAFAHDGGGFRASTSRALFLADPIMHLFEASLAWIEADDIPFWNTLADELADLFLTRMYEPKGARIREAFDADWRPAPGPEGRILMPGHHYEWAWLLECWALRLGRADARAVARALYASAERGVDPASGLVVDALREDFSIDRGSSRLWPQTERVKAALLLAPAEEADAAPYLASAVQAARASERYLDPAAPGLWTDTPIVGGAPEPAAALASSFYHIAGAILALEGAQARLASAA